MHSSPHRKFEKCAAHCVLIRPDVRDAKERAPGKLQATGNANINVTKYKILPLVVLSFCSLQEQVLELHDG